MAVLSAHQECLEQAVIRVAALDLGGLEDRVIRRAIMAGSWETGTPSGDYVVVSGWGALRAVGGDDTCSHTLGYPLTIAPVYRTTKEWDPTDEDAQLAVTQTLLDAFLDKPFPLTYPGASNDNVILVGGLTLEGVVESFQKIRRQLVFEVQVTHMRT